MLKRVLKFAVIGAAVLAALLVIAGIILKIKYPPEKIKGMILDFAKTKIHREVELEKISVGIIGGVKIKGFKISESPDFKAGTFAELGNAELRVSYLPLLAGKIVISKVALNSAKATVIRLADGKTFNFSDLMATTAEPKPAEPKPAAPEAAPLNILVNRVVIKNGSFEFIDKSTSNIQAKLSGINLDVKGFSLIAPFSINLKVGVAARLAGQEINTKIDYKGKFNIAGAGTLWIDKLDIDGQGIKARLNGAVDNVMAEPSFKIKLASTVTFPDAQALVPIPPNTVVLAGPVNIDVSGEGNLNNITSAGTINASNLDVKYQDIFHKPSGAGIFVRYEIAAQNLGENLNIKSVGLEIGKDALTLSGNVTGLTSGKPKLNIKGAISKLDLQPVMAFVPQYANAVSGNFSCNWSATGTLPDIKAKGDFDLARASIRPMQGLELTETGMHGEFTHDSLALTRFESRFNGSPLTLKLDVANFKSPRINFTGHLDTLDVKKLLTAFTGTESKTTSKPLPPPAPPAAKSSDFKASAKGKFDIGKVTHDYYDGEKVQIEWNMPNLSADTKTLTGNINFSMGKGKLHNLPLLTKLANAVSPKYTELSYSSIISNIELGNGEARVKKGEIHSTQMDINAQGTYTISNGNLDFVVFLKIPKENLGANIAGELGKFGIGGDLVPLEFELKGTPANPVYKLRARALEKQIREKAKEEIQEKKEEFKEQIQEKKEEFKEQLQEKGTEELKKQFKKLFGK